jgi:D-tagatose-1,6-bisphosphate aldolase subunit GatZ/KbaZ
MSCADDPQALGDELIAERTAALSEITEAAWRSAGGEPPVYIIGSEVPVPGGAHETLDELVPTTATAARATLDRHRAAFDEVGLGKIWPRIIALVVQPAVEFDHLRVIDYRHEGTRALRTVLDDEPGLVFEAHSTDYQQTAQLEQLVEDHWAILKVGPGLTFAMREALFALEEIERELIPEEDRSYLAEVIERQMLERPEYWTGYYDGSPAEQRIARRFSYSDRLRYYWPDPIVVRAEERLYANLSAQRIPLPLISQFLPDQYARVREGTIDATPRALVIDKVRDSLRPYAIACALTHELPSHITT